MTAELEQNISERRFRRGESPGRPLGGNIADEPFAQALYEAACLGGWQTQLALAQALGKGQTGQRVVCEWYRARSVPSPKEFGNILVVIDPPEEIREKLVATYALNIQAGRGVWGGTYGSEASLANSRRQLKSSETPIGKWLVAFCIDNRLTLTDWARKLGISSSVLYRNETSRGGRDRIGIDTLSLILERMPSGFDLSGEKTAELAEAVAQTIERGVAKGREFKTHPSMLVKRQQKLVPCKTYIGDKAGEKLGVTRERVRQLRRKYNLPQLLREEHIEFLKDQREKMALLFGPRPEIALFDSKVKGLRQKDLTNSEIASRLMVPIHRVNASVGRLIKREEIVPRRPGRPKKRQLRA